MSKKTLQTTLDPLPPHFTGPKRTILTAALKCFSRSGYGGFTFADVSKETGLSRQRILYHYDEPEEVLLELLAVWAEQGRIVTIEHLARLTSTSYEDKIVGISDAMFFWMQKYPELAKLTPVILHAARANPKVKEIFGKSMQVGRDRVIDLLLLLTKNPRLANRLAKVVHGIIMGAGLVIVTSDDWGSMELYRLSSELSIRQVLRRKESFT